jgi:ribosomal protein S27E
MNTELEKVNKMLNQKDLEIIKCKICGHVLISGTGICFFGKGTELGCLKCGNTYIFGENSKEIDE